MKENNYKILILIIILALILRLPNLLDKEKGTDEKLSIRNAEKMKDIFSIDNFYKALPNEVNPPFFFTLLGMSLLLYDSVISIKISILIISLLGIIAFYALSKRLFNKNFAILATALYSISPMHIILSQHIRSYILLLLLFTLSIYCLYKFTFEDNSKALVPLIFIDVISIYTHYYAGLFIAGSGITVLIINYFYKRTKLKQFILTNAIIFILSIPALMLLKFQASRLFQDPTINLLKPSVIPYPLYKMSVMADVSTTLANFPYLLALFPILLALAVYGIYNLYKEDKAKAVFLLGNFSIPYIILSITGFIWPTHSFRYLMFLLPVYLIMISYGIYSIKNTLLKTIILATVIAGWVLVIVYYYSISTVYHWPEFIAI